MARTSLHDLQHDLGAWILQEAVPDPFSTGLGPDMLLATLPGPQRQVQLMETAQNGIPNGPVAGTSCPTQKHAGVTWDLV